MYKESWNEFHKNWSRYQHAPLVLTTYSDEMNFYNEIPRLIIDAAKYFWSNLGSHYSDLHTCILSLASVSNINLDAMVKENPVRFQQQTHLSLLLEIISNTWFPPVIKDYYNYLVKYMSEI